MARRVGFGDGDPKDRNSDRKSDPTTRREPRETDRARPAWGAQAAARRVGAGARTGTGAPSEATKPAAWRTIAAIAVGIGVLLWVIADLGGPERALLVLQAVVEGVYPLSDLLFQLIRPLIVLAVAWFFLLRRRSGESAAAPTRSASARPGAVSPAPKDKPSGLPTGIGRLVVGAFLTVWLIGWTAGIVFAFGALMSEWDSDAGVSVFLIIWLTFATAGWVFVVRILAKLIRGE